ncbi:hypothetical protein ABTX82_25505 [Streptomyces lavendulae]|uniref:aromatic-ring hydroxylase C-terminal domain-containing protein n=1 Tax=Streptomyces lavendulae TaxID=1914 RepID=UPI003331933E
MLLDLAGDAGVAAVADGYGERVRVVTAAGPAGAAPAAPLVRPDGCTAWAVDADGDRERALRELAGALTRWFGSPGPAGA